MLLPEGYKTCTCGAKLNKRNRFGVKLEAPDGRWVNNQKRQKDKKPFHFKTLVHYMCEDCFIKLKKIIGVVHTGHPDGCYVYYPDQYPV